MKANEQKQIIPQVPQPTAAGEVTGPAYGQALSPVGALAEWQLIVAAARAAILAEAGKLVEELGVDGALREFVRKASTGDLSPELAETVRAANARCRADGRPLALSTLYLWRSKARDAVTPAERLRRLAPDTAGKRWQLTGDVAAVLAKYRQPNKPSLRWCVAQVINEQGGDFDSLYSRARREMAKLPKQVFHVGRHTGSALKALQPFRRRDFLQLAPNAVWTGDGHGAKLTIAHPDTGNRFVPEVTLILDVATRYVVGWSVALSENCLAVSDALRHGVSRHGIPLVYYSDNGGGQKNKMLDAPVTGILGGLGIHHETGIPGNAQGRGVIERAWRTILLPLARRFATFQGKGADRDTLRRVTHEIDRTLRAAQKGAISTLPKRLPTFQEFIVALEDEIEIYNRTHRHSSLPKLDGANHATPAEYRASRLAGAEVHVPTPADLQALFMPSVMRLAARGEVKLWNGIYFNRDLMLVDGEQVRVCYDIHDASYVLVRKASGEYICRADLGGNSSAYMPKPFIERLREERAARRRERLEAKLEEVEAERRQTSTVGSVIDPAEMVQLEEEFARGQLPAPVNVLSLPTDDAKHKHWKTLDERRCSGVQLSEDEERFWNAWQGQSYFRLVSVEEEKYHQWLKSRK